MRTLLLAGLLALLPSVAAAQAPADPDDRAAAARAPADPYARAERRVLRQRMVEQFDADGDGRLTGPEKREARKAMKALKRHHKAKRRAVKRAHKFDRIVARMDADGDGVIGPDEAGARFDRLRRFDADGDGWVTKEEFVRGRRGARRGQ